MTKISSVAWTTAFLAILAVACPVRAYDRVSPTFDIPRLSGIRIDGKADDWKDAGFRVDAFPMLGCAPCPVRRFRRSHAAGMG